MTATTTKPVLFLCNDDGIYAPGIRTLHEAVAPLGIPHVVAPGDERSAVGHAITVFDPIKVKLVDIPGAFRGQAVSGTPADCAKLAICSLMERPPDLALSGINHGPNTGISVLYSGTVSAATEASVLGVPAIALSLATFGEPNWDTARAVARRIVRLALERHLSAGWLLNVNIPNLPLEEIRGTAVTRVGRSRYREVFHRRTDPRGNDYYWLDGDLELLDDGPGTDIRAVEEGYVSITPLHSDLTHTQRLAELDAWNADGGFTPA
jgi:5'-nucleotidase